MRQENCLPRRIQRTLYVKMIVGCAHTPDMPRPKRHLRVVKSVGQISAVAVCTACDRQLKTPLPDMAGTSGAQENLKMQFDNHKCKGESEAA